MRLKRMRKLTLDESMGLLLLAGDMEEKDATLASLVRRLAAGDDTALIGAIDRLKELGEERAAERLKATVLE